MCDISEGMIIKWDKVIDFMDYILLGKKGKYSENFIIFELMCGLER